MTCAVSILQLDTSFPRVPGDVASRDTYRDDVEIIRIPNATVGRIVSDRPDLIEMSAFEDAILHAKAEVVVTSCGFLAFWQTHLAAFSDRPFISSSLLALGALSQTYAPGEILILAFDADRLSGAHLGDQKDYAAGVLGLPANMHLRKVIEGNQAVLDTKRVERELTDFIATARQPQHKHILLECTNLPPYKAALHAATDLPITDILSMVEATRAHTVEPEFLLARASP